MHDYSAGHHTILPTMCIAYTEHLLIPVSSVFALSQPSCTPPLSAFILHPSGGRRQCVTTGLCWRWPQRTRLPGTTWATQQQVGGGGGAAIWAMLQQEGVGGRGNASAGGGGWQSGQLYCRWVGGWGSNRRWVGRGEEDGKLSCAATGHEQLAWRAGVRILHLPIHPHTACMTGLGRWDATAGHWRTLLPSLSPILTRVYHQIPNLLLAADGHVVLLAPPIDPHTAAC